MEQYLYDDSSRVITEFDPTLSTTGDPFYVMLKYECQTNVIYTLFKCVQILYISVNLGLLSP